MHLNKFSIMACIYQKRVGSKGAKGHANDDVIFCKGGGGWSLITVNYTYRSGQKFILTFWLFLIEETDIYQMHLVRDH